MSIVRVKKTHPPYIQVETTALNDTHLSFRAKGLHTYLMSKPDNWQVYLAQLEQASPTEGRDAIRTALKELEDAGYIRKMRLRGAKGRMAGWDTTIFETPMLASDTDDTTDTGSTDIGLTEVGSTEVGSTEVGSTEVGQSATSNTGIKQDLKVVKLEETKSPLSPPSGLNGSRRTPKYVHDPLTPDEARVLGHLRATTGRKYRTPGEIASGLRYRGLTADECCLVIDWWAAVKIRRDPEQDQYFDNETPFRAKHFDKYLAAAEKWEGEGRQPYTGRGSKPDPYDLTELIRQEQEAQAHDAQ